MTGKVPRVFNPKETKKPENHGSNDNPRLTAFQRKLISSADSHKNNSRYYTPEQINSSFLDTTQKIIKESKKENTGNMTVGELAELAKSAKLIDESSSFTEMMGSDLRLDLLRPADHQGTTSTDSLKIQQDQLDNFTLTTENESKNESTPFKTIREISSSLTPEEMAKDLAEMKKTRNVYNFSDAMRKKVKNQNGLSLEVRKQIISKLQGLCPNMNHLDEEDIRIYLSSAYRIKGEDTKRNVKTDSSRTIDNIPVTPEEMAKDLAEMKKNHDIYNFSDAMKEKVKNQNGLSLEVRRQIISKLQELCPNMSHFDEGDTRRYLSNNYRIKGKNTK